MLNSAFATAVIKDSSVKPIIFSQLIDYAAFVDTIVLSVFGVRRRRPSFTVRLGQNLPIGGAKSAYARLQQGICIATGNPFALRYGRFHSKFAPPFRLTLRSEEVALTRCGIERVLNAQFRKGTRHQVSVIETTLDTSIPLDFFRQHAWYRLKRAQDGPTLYMFSPTSNWQVRAYAKTNSTTRLEFVLRRGFLRAKGIEHTGEVATLRAMPLFEGFPLRELRSRVRAFNPSSPIYKTVSECRQKGWRAQDFVRASPEERLMRMMLERLVW
jgi:hypothetical protein